jgi:tetratricopeptide (TPR) repeat protein
MYREAIADFQHAITLKPKQPENYKYVGDALIKDGDFLNAIVSYDAAIAAGKSRKNSLKDAELADLYNGKGEANFQLGKYAAAMQNFNHSLKIRAGVGELYFNRAKTYLKLNQLKEAEDNIHKALGYEPANSLWISKLGEIYYQQGKFDKALTQFNLAIPKDSRSAIIPFAVYQRAQSYVKLNNYAEAYKDYRTIQSAGLQKNFPDLNTEMGHVFLAFNQPDSALKYFEKDNRNAFDVMSMYGIAIVHAQKSQVDQSFQWLEKSLATGKIPRSVIANDKRIQLLRADKRYKKLMKKYY